MMGWVKNIWLYLFCHHLLKSDTISWVSFWLINCCVICYGGFKASYVLSFVKGDMFIGIIRYQCVNRCFPFNLVNTVNDVYVGVSSLCWIVISDEISYMFLNYWSCDLNWYITIVSWWYFKWWFDCANCGLLFTVFLCKLRIYHPFVYNNSSLCPKHMNVKTSFGYLCQHNFCIW